MFKSSIEVNGLDSKDESTELYALVQRQYEMVLKAAIGMMPSPDVLHLYPLLDLRVPLLYEINMQALLTKIDELMKFAPKMDIVFHHGHFVEEVFLPSSKSLKSIQKSMELRSQLIGSSQSGKDLEQTLYVYE